MSLFLLKKIELTPPPPGPFVCTHSCALASAAKPMDNTDLDLYWRKRVVAEFVGYALREIRGDDMRATRVRIARHAL